MKVTIRIMAIIFSILLCFVFLLSSIRYVAFNQDIYKRIQTKHEIAEFVLMSQESLDKITNHLIEYMKGEKQDIVISEVQDGVRREIFNEREKMHMEDVQYLFKISEWVLVIIICLLAAILLAGFLMDMDIMRSIFIKTVIITMIITVLLFIMIIFYMIVDFYNFWIFFHEILFTNDLYFLDPYTDLLVNIMPLEFFVSICFNVSFYFGMLFAGTFAITAITKLMKKVINNG
ncbi:MAG: DUF1461 domain-containing protein [Clostridia bacterium]|jgi:integral membrane protein (TIGR01906 family)